MYAWLFSMTCFVRAWSGIPEVCGNDFGAMDCPVKVLFEAKYVGMPLFCLAQPRCCDDKRLVDQHLALSFIASGPELQPVLYSMPTVILSSVRYSDRWEIQYAYRSVSLIVLKYRDSAARISRFFHNIGRERFARPPSS